MPKTGVSFCIQTKFCFLNIEKQLVEAIAIHVVATATPATAKRVVATASVFKLSSQATF